MADDRRQDEVQAGESWKRAKRRPSATDGTYDRGAEQAQAFAAVIDRWKHKDGAPSKNNLAGLIGRHLGRTYWPNDVQRALDGELRMHHLKPNVVEAYCVAFGRTDPASVAEAFHAIGLLPPEVTEAALKLAIATSRSGAGAGRRSA